MDRLLTRLKALADETRLKIIVVLLNYDLCVGALARHLEISEAAVSQQLQILRKAGLVKGEKRSYWTHYRVEKEAFKQIVDDLKELSNRQISPEFICQQGLAGEKSLSCRKKCFDRIEGLDDGSRGDSK